MWTVKGYIIIDGFQRVEATRQVHGADAKIKARVCKVSHKVAITMAAAANQAHGGQLEKADREKIAKTLLLEFPKKSNVQIAKLAFLSEGTIRKYRKEMPEAHSESRIGSDGREISLPKKKESPEILIDMGQELPQTEDSSPIIEKASPITESSNKVSTEDQADSRDTGRSKKEGITDSDQKTTAPSELNKTPSEVDILLGQFNDLMDNLEIMKSFINSAAEKNVLSPEEKKQLINIKNALQQLDVFSS
jgi:hypothetical protein